MYVFHICIYLLYVRTYTYTYTYTYAYLYVHMDMYELQGLQLSNCLWTCAANWDLGVFCTIHGSV